MAYGLLEVRYSSDSCNESEGTMKVLIVDDNEQAASIVREIIEDENYTARTARDGEEGGDKG